MTISPDVAWIRVRDAKEWRDELAPLRDAAIDPETDRVDNILLAHSLHPAGLAGHLGVYKSAMRGTRGLRKVDRELVALVVSQANDCHY